MVWGGISLEGHTDLPVTTNGTLTAVKYSDAPYTGAVGPGFRCRTMPGLMCVARVCRQFLDDECIDAIDWPSRFPSLNPIENVLDIVCWCIRCCQVSPQAVQELTDALIQVWEEIPAHHPSSHQEHKAQTLCTGMRRPYTPLSHIMSWISLWFQNCTLISVCFWIQPPRGWWFWFPLTIVKSLCSQWITQCTSVKIFNMNNLFIDILWAV